ncbi:MAG: tryptophan--tRNA ligase [Candidatus Sungbacteria bacterium]|nr:tryptophan--tRNA ligase [Candidatus Sungbacteria bacterium]
MKRILTGDRPTDSKFHLGNYVGTLKNRVLLQDKYETFISVVDLHMLTTHFEHTEGIRENTEGLMLNYLAVGLDHAKVTFFRQSHVPAIPQLALILGMITPLPFLERQPALKEKLNQGHQLTYGLVGYPVLMAADILSMGANLVPVGKDQKAHVEFARDIGQKFNAMYGNVLIIPEPLIGGDEGVLVGTDGKAKMSKSLKNAIFLLDDETTLREKVMGMYTDPTRIHANDPGHVEGNPVFVYHDFFNENKEEVREMKERYQKGEVSDKEVKEQLVKALVVFLNPIQERYAYFKDKKDIVADILSAGEKKVVEIAQKTLDQVKEAMGF